MKFRQVQRLACSSTSTTSALLKASMKRPWSGTQRPSAGVTVASPLAEGAVGAAGGGGGTVGRRRGGRAPVGGGGVTGTGVPGTGGSGAGPVSAAGTPWAGVPPGGTVAVGRGRTARAGPRPGRGGA